MPTPTYTPIASQTLTSTASEVVFSNIAADWRDLILVVANAKTTGTGYVSLRFNSDLGSNYSRVSMGGRGGNQVVSNTTTSTALNVQTDDSIGTGGNAIIIFQIFDYAQTNKHKSVLARQGQYTDQSNYVWSMAGRWASTSAITTVACRAGAPNWEVGVTFSLYGIAS